MHQIDLETLIEQCATQRARTYIREAVDCYKIGAYRACVITTWVAVVFDIVDKLRDLALTGDTQAAAKVAEFETINAKRDVEAALKFEREILSIAQAPFEFLTAYEVMELGRLQDDRNRCAHPNLVREDEIFRPTPELARAHIRHAVDLVLRCPPVQGKSALGLIQKEVESQYFPTTVDGAHQILKKSPIARARQNLIKRFVFGALTACLKEPLSSHQISQRLAAISAVRRIHADLTTDLLKHETDAVIAKLDDVFLGRAVCVLDQIPDLLSWLSDTTVGKLNAYVAGIPDAEVNVVLPHAFAREEFRAAAESRLTPVTDETLKILVASSLAHGLPPPAAVVEATLSRFETSVSFDSANSRSDDLVRPLIPLLDRAQLERLVSAGANSQVLGSFRFPTILAEVKATTKISPVDFDAILTKLGIGEHFPHLLSTASAETVS